MAEQTEVDKGIDAAIAALMTLKSKPAEQPAPAQAPAHEKPNVQPAHEHHFKEGKNGGLICADCNKAAVMIEGNNPKDILDKLTDIYHSESHDWLTCPGCRGLIEEQIRGLGHSVEEKRGQLIIDLEKEEK